MKFWNNYWIGKERKRIKDLRAHSGSDWANGASSFIFISFFVMSRFRHFGLKTWLGGKIKPSWNFIFLVCSFSVKSGWSNFGWFSTFSTKKLLYSTCSNAHRVLFSIQDGGTVTKVHYLFCWLDCLLFLLSWVSFPVVIAETKTDKCASPNFELTTFT